MGEDVSKNIQRLSAVEMMQIFNSGVYISPTTRCNARCRHCIAQDDEPEMVDVKEEDLEKLALACSRNKTRTLTGYKPLGYEEILAVYKMAY